MKQVRIYQYNMLNYLFGLSIAFINIKIINTDKYKLREPLIVKVGANKETTLINMTDIIINTIRKEFEKQSNLDKNCNNYSNYSKTNISTISNVSLTNLTNVNTINSSNISLIFKESSSQSISPSYKVYDYLKFVGKTVFVEIMENNNNSFQPNREITRQHSSNDIIEKSVVGAVTTQPINSNTIKEKEINNNKYDFNSNVTDRYNNLADIDNRDTTNIDNYLNNKIGHSRTDRYNNNHSKNINNLNNDNNSDLRENISDTKTNYDYSSNKNQSYKDIKETKKQSLHYNNDKDNNNYTNNDNNVELTKEYNNTIITNNTITPTHPELVKYQKYKKYEIPSTPLLNTDNNYDLNYTELNKHYVQHDAKIKGQDKENSSTNRYSPFKKQNNLNNNEYKAINENISNEKDLLKPYHISNKQDYDKLYLNSERLILENKGRLEINKINNNDNSNFKDYNYIKCDYTDLNKELTTPNFRNNNIDIGKYNYNNSDDISNISSSEPKNFKNRSNRDIYINKGNSGVTDTNDNNTNRVRYNKDNSYLNSTSNLREEVRNVSNTMLPNSSDVELNKISYTPRGGRLTTYNKEELLIKNDSKINDKNSSYNPETKKPRTLEDIYSYNSGKYNNHPYNYNNKENIPLIDNKNTDIINNNHINQTDNDNRVDQRMSRRYQFDNNNNSNKNDTTDTINQDPNSNSIKYPTSNQLGSKYNNSNNSNINEKYNFINNNTYNTNNITSKDSFDLDKNSLFNKTLTHDFNSNYIKEYNSKNNEVSNLNINNNSNNKNNKRSFSPYEKYKVEDAENNDTKISNYGYDFNYKHINNPINSNNYTHTENNNDIDAKFKRNNSNIISNKEDINSKLIKTEPRPMGHYNNFNELNNTSNNNTIINNEENHNNRKIGFFSNPKYEDINNNNPKYNLNYDMNKEIYNSGVNLRDINAKDSSIKNNSNFISNDNTNPVKIDFGYKDNRAQSSLNIQSKNNYNANVKSTRFNFEMPNDSELNRLNSRDLLITNNMGDLSSNNIRNTNVNNNEIKDNDKLYGREYYMTNSISPNQYNTKSNTNKEITKPLNNDYETKQKYIKEESNYRMNRIDYNRDMPKDSNDEIKDDFMNRNNVKNNTMSHTSHVKFNNKNITTQYRNEFSFQNDRNEIENNLNYIELNKRQSNIPSTTMNKEFSERKDYYSFNRNNNNNNSNIPEKYDNDIKNIKNTSNNINLEKRLVSPQRSSDKIRNPELMIQKERIINNTNNNPYYFSQINSNINVPNTNEEMLNSQLSDKYNFIHSATSNFSSELNKLSENNNIKEMRKPQSGLMINNPNNISNNTNSKTSNNNIYSNNFSNYSNFTQEKLGNIYKHNNNDRISNLSNFNSKNI